MVNYKKAILLPDIHHPHHDVPCIKSILKFVPDFKPDILVYTGDQMNMDAVDHWKKMKGRIRLLEGKRIKAEYEAFDKEILTPFEKVISKDCKKVYMLGNHEDWIQLAIDQNPQGEGYWEIDKNLRLKERGYHVVSYGNTYQLGKLRVIHGIYTSLHHAKKTVSAYEKSVVYGHTHDIQKFTKVTPENVRDFHTAESIGCLCSLNPNYAENRPNKWVHGFAIVYIRPDNSFNLYHSVITYGRFTGPNGITYDGN